LTIFMVIVTPVYWLITADANGVPELTGTVALILTTFLVLMIFVYLLLVARRMEPRPEDKKTGEIAEGAGELGFYPPQSKWPFFLSLTFVPVVLAPVFGWWLMLIGFGFGFITLTGLLYEFLPRRSRALSGLLLVSFGRADHRGARRCGSSFATWLAVCGGAHSSVLSFWRLGGQPYRTKGAAAPKFRAADAP
jgi:hypothetical protein